MSRRRRALWRSCLLGALAGTAAQAEMDAQDYKLDRSIESERSRRQIRSQIERERELEAQRAAEQAAEAYRRAAEAAAAWARRSYPERLLHERCTECHPAEQYLAQQHTWLGWHVVMMRMRWFNRATMAWPEQAVLAAELNRIRPAPPVAALLEYAGAAATLVLPPLVGWGAWRWRRRAASSPAP